jgi:hypothetical protein
MGMKEVLSFKNMKTNVPDVLNGEHDIRLHLFYEDCNLNIFLWLINKNFRTQLPDIILEMEDKITQGINIFRQSLISDIQLHLPKYIIN